MTEREFIWWLHGFLEISGVDALSKEQLNVIKDHIQTFFVKITRTPPAPNQPVSPYKRIGEGITLTWPNDWQSYCQDINRAGGSMLCGQWSTNPPSGMRYIHMNDGFWYDTQGGKAVLTFGGNPNFPTPHITC